MLTKFNAIKHSLPNILNFLRLKCLVTLLAGLRPDLILQQVMIADMKDWEYTVVA